MFNFSYLLEENNLKKTITKLTRRVENPLSSCNPMCPIHFFRAFNSGVSLIHVARLRRSKEFAKLVSSPDLVFKLMQAMRSNDEEGANLQVQCLRHHSASDPPARFEIGQLCDHRAATLVLICIALHP